MYTAVHSKKGNEVLRDRLIRKKNLYALFKFVRTQVWKLIVSSR